MKFNNFLRTFIVAEIGVNHEGDEGVAIELVKKAAFAGVDAVKFQVYTPEHYISSEQPDRFRRAKKFCLTRSAITRLAEFSESLGLIFFATPFGLSDADFLDEIQPLFKISSGDLTFHKLIGHVASKGKPIIISTGLGSKREIEDAIRVVLVEQSDAIENGSLMLMHCNCAYPTPDEDANLNNIKWINEEFGVPAGYSDHTLGTKACELAVAVGACALEKHFTYRRENQVFHDHQLSANPEEMRDLVVRVRRVETYLGNSTRQPSPSEQGMEENMRRSIGTLIDIPAGVKIERSWLTWVRPAWGLAAEQMDGLVGRTLNKCLLAGQIVRKEDLTD